MEEILVFFSKAFNKTHVHRVPCTLHKHHLPDRDSLIYSHCSTSSLFTLSPIAAVFISSLTTTTSSHTQLSLDSTPPSIQPVCSINPFQSPNQPSHDRCFISMHVSCMCCCTRSHPHFTAKVKMCYIMKTHDLFGLLNLKLFTATVIPAP